MLEIDLTDKIALVTGGSKGVGEGISKVLAQAGATVIINCSNNIEKANEVKEKIIEDKGKADVIKANIIDPKEVASMVKWVVEKYKKIDILVNNAGMSSVGNIEELAYEDIQKVFELNINGTINCCKEVIPYMSDLDTGSIINIASTSMYTGGGGGLHYAGSKAAIMGITRNLSKTYAKKGIRTNALAISLIDTELFRNRYKDQKDREAAIDQVPVRRLGTPEDVGYMAAFLSSPLGSYINGEIVIMDGGRLYA